MISLIIFNNYSAKEIDMKKRIIILSGYLLFISAFIKGCGNNEELSSFQQNMMGFCNNITSINYDLTSINANDDNAVDLLTSCLEKMSVEFENLAAMEVPKEFSSVEDLADDAFEYMQEATRLYKNTYEDKNTNEAFLTAAVQNYDSAMKRIGYIATILQGEIPEGATVIEDEGTEFEPYTE